MISTKSECDSRNILTRTSRGPAIVSDDISTIEQCAFKGKKKENSIIPLYSVQNSNISSRPLERECEGQWIMV